MNSFFRDPRTGIFLIAILNGLALNLASIVSQVRFLEVASPRISTTVSILASFLFCYFMPRILNPPSQKVKYSTYLSVGWLAGYSLALFFLGIQIGLPQVAVMGIWFFLSVLMSETSRLSLIELANRHVNPASVGAFYYSLIIAHELGSIGAVGWIFLTDIEHKPPFHVALIATSFVVVAVALTRFRFGPRKVIEVRFSKRGIDQSQLIAIPKRLMQVLLGMGLAIGIFRQFQDFQVRSAIKTLAGAGLSGIPSGPGSTDPIFDAILQLYLVGGFITVIVAWLISVFSLRFRVSPLRMIVISAVLLLLAQLALVAAPISSLTSYLAFGSAYRMIERGFYFPSVVLLLSFFVGPQRARLRFRHHVMVLSVSGLLFMGLSGVEWIVGRNFVLSIAPEIAILSAIILGALVYASRAELVSFFRQNIKGQKVAAILSATGLSYLRPKGFSTWMSEALASNPKKLLRKTIILGLGYSDEKEAPHVLMKEFQSDKEEIQVAVIDALGSSQSFYGLRFVLDVCLSGKSVKSLNVRLNAASWVSAFFGRKAIPVLMVGLNDEDPRVVANALEALAQFNDPKLASVFTGFLESPVPRVRANALMGLGRIKSERKFFEIEMNRALETGMRDLANDPMILSIIYVVGKLKDFGFLDRLKQLEKGVEKLPKERSIPTRRMLAWAYASMGETRGFEIFYEMIREFDQSGMPLASLLHFFTQLSQEDRYDCVQVWLKRVSEKHSENTAFLQETDRLIALLKESIFDFHAEADYAADLRDSFLEARTA
ncbi:MAG: HEAT repeat domain-containing protein [Bdellovibrionales bacterium]|nr:HEAT repeat domain-containing protein [Bdellovibrionales bacterium]